MTYARRQAESLRVRCDMAEADVVHAERAIAEALAHERERAALEVDKDAAVHWKGMRNSADLDEEETSAAIAVGLAALAARIRALPNEEV